MSREPGATFALENICWIDFETRAATDLKQAGPYRYAVEADAIVLAYAIGSAPVASIAVPRFGAPLKWSDLPSSIHRHYERVARGEAIFAAWNAGFDKAIWNYATIDFPFLEPHHIIDVMAQAVASGLPADLAMAARMSGSTHKVESGKNLIKLFCLPNSSATPQSHPAEWRQFSQEYATGDIEAMRSVFLGTRQLPLVEWKEYWTMEAINERGVGVDLPMVEHAAKLARDDQYFSTEEIRRITGGAVSTVNQVARMTDWLLDRVPVEGRSILLKREEDVDENGEVIRPAKFALRRRQVERLIALCKDDEKLTDVTRLLQIRLYGGSKTPAKFSRILTQHTDGILRGQYVFNGAAQTGRASSRGVQCVTGDHEALTRSGWRRLDEIVGPCEIMAWSAVDHKLRWETGTVNAFGVPDQVAHIDGTMIRGTYTLDHRMPNRHTEGDTLIDYTPQMLIDRSAKKRSGFIIVGEVNQSDALFSDAQLRLRVAMQADGHWAKRAATWRFTKVRKIERLEMLLDEAGVPFRRKTEKDGVTLFRVSTTNVPSWLIKDFGPWVLTLSARQAALVLEEIRLWDGYSHTQHGHLQITSPRKDQMEWVVTIAALAGLSATLNKYPYNKRKGTRWVVYVRSSVTTSLHRSDIEVTKGINPVFCPTLSSGYWLCRARDRVFVTGNTHNLARDALPYEMEAIDAILAGCTYQEFSTVGTDEPVARKLSLLIRPVFVPQPDKLFVWSDWSQIEARIVPWLADHFPVARERLQIFRDVDANPSLPDLYVRTTAAISHISIAEVTKELRQRGKVAELALGFCGGVGALLNMAAGYGLYLSEEEAKQIVRNWREVNSWVGDYADEVWDAMLFARRVPGHFVTAGRIGFVFLQNYLGGSLLMRLPSGRFLTYRAIRETLEDVLNDDDEVIGKEMKLTYARSYGRSVIWKGIFLENATQACAADFLRETLVRIEDEGYVTRLHTHDEVLVETPEQEAHATATKLREVMRRGFDWSEGLPLMSEETISEYYTKCSAMHVTVR